MREKIVLCCGNVSCVAAVNGVEPPIGDPPDEDWDDDDEDEDGEDEDDDFDDE